MTETEWYNLVKNSEKTAMLGHDLKKIHYKLSDGREMVEEYNLSTGVLCKRAWKTNKNIYKSVKWEIEVGDPLSVNNKTEEDAIGIKESENSPFVVHRVTKSKLEWRIRNLPYTIDVYQVTINPEDKCIVVRTTNRKYFKKIPMLELQRLNLTPCGNSSVSVSHSCNTLIISYQKPSELIAFENLIQEELKDINVIDNADIDCKQS